MMTWEVEALLLNLALDGAALNDGKSPSEAGWAPEPVWRECRGEKSCPAKNRYTNSPNIALSN
jgi:hypothetical protein